MPVPETVVRRGRVRVERGVTPGACDAYGIGQRIREARLRLGLRQEDLSAASGMARPNIARIEHGKHVPSMRSLVRIAGALGIALHVLLAPVLPSLAPDEEGQLAEAGLGDFSAALSQEDERS